MLTVGLTYDLKTDYKPKRGDPEDIYAEFDHPAVIRHIAKLLRSQGVQVKRIGNVHNLLENLDNLGADIVFNISEGADGRNRESQVPILLELKDIPYVGADGLTLGITLDKIMTKKILICEGIPTPKFFEARTTHDYNTDHLKFPLIVKPRFEGSSKGLSDKSKVGNKEELALQINFVINTYNQPALVEEFISGSEYTVAIVGNEPNLEVYDPVQVKIDGKLKLGDLFYTFARIQSPRLEYVYPAKISAKLRDKIKDLARRTYNAVECRDFGRVDFRVDDEGNPYVLEINPLPSLSTEDVFKLIAEHIGITYADMIGKILNSALNRWGLKNTG